MLWAVAAPAQPLDKGFDFTGRAPLQFTGNAEHLAVLVADGEGPGADPSHTAIRPDDPVGLVEGAEATRQHDEGIHHLGDALLAAGCVSVDGF